MELSQHLNFKFPLRLKWLRINFLQNVTSPSLK